MATYSQYEKRQISRLYALIRGLYLLLFALLPFSLPVSVGSIQIELPSEGLMGLQAVLLLVWFVKNGWWSKDFYRAPLTIFSLAFLVWMVLGIPFSAHPLISFKYSVVALTHWWVFYHGIGLVFKGLPTHFFRYWTAYALSFCGIILYAWTVHAQYNFSVDSSVLTARPFYFDHALYSCCMLLLLGVFFVRILLKNESVPPEKYQRWLCVLFSLIFLIGIYLGYSRAAWLSMLGALGVISLVVLLRLRFRGLMSLLGGTLLLILLSWPLLFQQISQNKTESKKGNWWDQIVSVANVRTDVSNLERLNRYSCAWRMFKDRPLVGFGAGTFPEAYLSYQRKEEMTRISVTTAGSHPPGRGGGAHSEYLQALSEMGLPGGLLWLGLVFSSIWTGLRVFHTGAKRAIRLLTLGLLFGVLTFFVHALFNNFIHQGKVASLVWSALAVLVLLDSQRVDE